MKFLEGSPEPIAHAAVDGADKVVHVFNARMMAEQYATAGGYKLEAVFRGVPASTQAARDVLTERWRQVALEGFSYHHDDKHTGGELLDAAIAYLSSAGWGEQTGAGRWPAFWPSGSFKARGERDDLVRGIALALAELERMDRKAERGAAAQVPA